MSVRIAQISCGTEYSGIQHEVERTAKMVGGEIIIPEISTGDIDQIEDEFGFTPASSGLRVALARAKSVAEGRCVVDGAIILSCFRCAEGSIVRHIIRRYLQRKVRIPLMAYSFTERTKVGALLLRMEALANVVKLRTLLARTKHEGLTLGLDSGSTTTKAVVMKEGEILSANWMRTTEVMETGKKVVEDVLGEASLKLNQVEAVGVTGYGRRILGEYYNAKIRQEEITVCAKGASYLADKQEGGAMIIDIGGADNKATTIFNGVPDGFTVGGVCAGASGKFLDLSSSRLGVDIATFGELAAKGNPKEVPMNAYCIVFGTQDLVAALGMGKRREDVAAAACYSVAEQFSEQQLQEIDVREPIIQIGGTSLVKGLVRAVEDILKMKVIVPKYSQYAGAVGAAVLASAIRE